MRILQINAYYGFGSTGNIMRSLEKAGTENGLEMYSIYWLNRNKSIETPKVIFCGHNKEASMYAKAAKWVIFGGKLSYNTSMTKRIIDAIDNVKPQVIHLHNLHGDFEYGSLDIPLLFEYIGSLNVKVIWTMHDCWAITGRCYYFSTSRCERWKNGCGKCPQRFFDRQGVIWDFSNQNWKRKKELYSLVDDMTVVTVSKWLEGIVRESMLSGCKVKTIYNGINTKVFFPKEDIVSGSKFKILCIGWDRRKGYKDYFKLSKLLKSDEEIHVVGRRPFFRAFRKLPQNMITEPAATSASEMTDIYRNADVYCNTSQAETFGLTTAESISCGTPVIGYNSTATPEIVGQGMKFGLCVEPGNIQEMYNAIKKIRKIEAYNSNENKKERHKYVEERFESNRMLDEYIELYRS